MKTKVRISHSAASQSGYKHLSIQILDERYKFRGRRKYPTLESIGSIEWQGHYDGEGKASGWYGATVKVEANLTEINRLLSIHKIMSYVYKRAERSEPADYLKIMNAEEHVYDSFLGNFIPLSANGLLVFELMQYKNNVAECYTRLIAPNKRVAANMALGYKLSGSTFIKETGQIINIKATKIEM